MLFSVNRNIVLDFVLNAAGNHRNQQVFGADPAGNLKDLRGTLFIGETDL